STPELSSFGPAQPGGGDASPAAADAHTNEERRLDALSVLWTLGKCLGAVLPVYLAGYYRVSTSLVAFGLVVYTGWRHTRDAKEARLRAAMRSLGAEEDHSAARGLSRGARDSPSWIGVPDVEKVEWLNKVLQQAWPFVGQYLEKLLVETIAPSIRASSTHLQTLSFTKIDMGSKAMKVVGIKAHTENDKGQVLLDVHISYVGDVEINVEIKRYFCKAGVKGIQLHGMMRVILEPLIGDVPIVGAVTMFFIRRPKLDINWTGLTNLLDIPGLNVMSDTMIMDAIASFLVLPNRLTVPLVPNLPVAQLRCPLPRGVVRIHLLEAENLAAKDNYVKGMISGMSDPYTIIRVGPQTFKSHHVDNSLSPKWGEMYEVIVHEVPGQELEVEVYDKDPDQDDFLGRTKVDLGMVKKARVLDEWFPLKDTSSGRVHLKMEWLCLLPSTEQLDQVIQRNKSVAASSKTTDPPSAAILVIYLDRAEALPMKKGNKEPSPMVQLSIQDVTRESRTCFGTTNPEWGDAFTFFIHDPRHMDIDIQVKDNDRVLSLGSLSIPLSRLLTSPDLSLDQWFQLENSEASSRISLHGVLRIHLVEARNLISKDKLMGGIVKGKSDPYVKTRVGGMTFRSNVIEENLNPTWNELYEVVLTQTPGQEPGQEVQFELYDKDMDSDDFLGRLVLGHSGKCVGMLGWFTVLMGVLHMLNEVKASYFLCIVLCNIESLFCSYSALQLFHTGDQPTGSLILPVRELLKEPDLVLDRWLSLDGVPPESQILLRAELKVRLKYSTVMALPACSEPYVSFILLPDKHKATKRKTSVKKKDLNPDFSEKFEFNITMEEACHRQLDLSVKNNVSFMSREREIIGKVSVHIYIKDFGLLGK
uniref:Extended synaptotagmin 1 n=1 Tax=Scleropages formosus TaxID=113540 RepID=A0A8C9T617_SCLFO